jgi:hypothetical protein
MAIPAILTFPSNLAPVVPTFVGNGSKIEVPDLQVVFWGPFWPGTGQLSVGDIMQAVTSIVNGPYLDGLQQYGYTGPVNLRQPIVNTGNPNFTFPPPGPNVNQTTTAMTAVQILVDTLRQQNAMGDVNSNHNLIVLVFLDPRIPFPQIFNAAGNPQSTVFGEHGPFIESQTLAPAIRFAYGFVCTLPGANLSAFDQATWTFSHELVESITNPFGGSGWVQTFPVAPGNQGEIGDVCNNTACVVDSIVVQPYWGVQQAACILPTGPRQLSLNQALTKHVSQDGPVQYAIVDMGPLCGKGTFDYVERTWDNLVAVTAVHTGYQVPVFTWSVNGTVLQPGASSLVVPATWISPTGATGFSIISEGPGPVLKVPLPAAAGGGISPVAHGLTAAAPAGLVGTTLLEGRPGFAGGVPAGAGIPVESPAGAVGTAVHPTLDPLHPNAATLRLAAFDSVLTIECGPGQGNVSFSVGCQVIENWDNAAGTTVTTKQSTTTPVAMANQEIVWGSSYQQAADDCYAKTHKAQGGIIPGVPLNPSDPGPEGTIAKVVQAQAGQQVKQAQAGQQVKQAGQFGQANKLP